MDDKHGDIVLNKYGEVIGTLFVCKFCGCKEVSHSNQSWYMGWFGNTCPMCKDKDALKGN